MARRNLSQAFLIGGAACALGAISPPAVHAEDLAETVRLLKARLDANEAETRALKAELDALRTKSAGKKPAPARLVRRPSEPASQSEAPAKSAAGTTVAPAPLPLLVNLSRGLMIETPDHANSFKIGGRILVDGGGSTMPEQGYSSVANFRQARLEVEGKALEYWNYKFQYDFTAGNTTKVGVVGGIRDAYIAWRYLNPLVLQVGQFFEPQGLEWTQSKNTTDFLERALLFSGPLHHIGFAALTHGANWSIKVGVFTTSTVESSLAPADGTPVVFGVPETANWVATGGGQYVDIAGRATYAPIMDDRRLLHFGVSGRFHRPNDSTAANDGLLSPGVGVKTESNILNENLLGAPDLSCGAVSFYGNPAVAGKCVRDARLFGAEFVASYGPASLQAEYLGARFDRDNLAILTANAAGNYAPGGSRVDFNGYYVYGTWYLTGESRAAAYQVDGLNPATFGQIKINNPLSAGGWGAWELAARTSAINLDNGAYAGSYFANVLAFAQGNPALQKMIGNSGVLGGREQDFTLGLNWYPDPGFRVMMNWTRVLHLTAPWDRAYLNGAHPNTVLMRVQADW
ncbi:OprO/OprP family phosphate-selective porin [Methylocystis heyeri]|uniref:Porin n=1 Tax=Methylocystis heyeri TaxID=391905 RepID=A0A6B8KDE4_9HYPH|nr:porin [Methylocystis heyeri]QGM45622.1 porin [Methylocystis heyeri]